MKESKIDTLLKKIFIVFVLIQPFLDVYFLYTDQVVSIFKFSPSTLIRFSIIGVMFIYMLFKYRKSKKILPVIAYVGVAIIYAVLHHLFVRNFTSYDPNNFGYSMAKEFFYIARLVIPVILMFIVVDFKFTFEELRKYIGIVAFIVGTVIVFANLLKIGLGSYTNEVIKDNIFGWFTGAYKQYSFYELASKGWFNFANQISGLLILLALITFYSLSKRMSVYNVYNVIVIMLSMLMLGTKVALYGMFLAIGSIVVIYIISYLKDRKVQNLNKYSVILMLVLVASYIGLIQFSPAQNRAEINTYIAENREKKTKDDDEIDMDVLNQKLVQVKDSSYEEKIAFIEENYEYYSINQEFIEDGYSYKIDPDFWLEEFQKPLEDRLNYRKLEEVMIKRVVSINGKSSSKWFGISYIRVQNIFNIERDFILQYYTIGIIGLIIFIIIPFVIPVFVMGLYILKRFKNLMTEQNMLLIVSILLILAIAYFSGNIIDSLIITIYLSFIIGVLFNNIFEKEEVKLLDEEKIDN